MIEKRDRAELRDEPMIVGRCHRGVVAACCYIARTYSLPGDANVPGLGACLDAVVVKPDMKNARPGVAWFPQVTLPMDCFCRDIALDGTPCYSRPQGGDLSENGSG